MSFNRVVSKKITGSALKDGKLITLSVATSTSHWSRPDTSVGNVGKDFKKSLPNYKKRLPAGTTELCVREYIHQSDADRREHFSVLCLKERGEPEIIHVPATKK